jgi:hypothetical protein
VTILLESYAILAATVGILVGSDAADLSPSTVAWSRQYLRRPLKPSGRIPHATAVR